jgi:hypothetical protein
MASVKLRLTWVLSGLKRRLIRTPSDQLLIGPSGLFDAKWYLARNPDVADARIDPLVHYLRHGPAEGRDPNPLFDSKWYLTQNPDVAAAEINPLVHYLRNGAREGRDPSAVFDTDWYLDQNPDVAAAGVNPLAHYLECGQFEGRNPNPSFNARWYLAHYPDVAAAGINPVVHYRLYGMLEGRITQSTTEFPESFSFFRCVRRHRLGYVVKSEKQTDRGLSCILGPEPSQAEKFQSNSGDEAPSGASTSIAAPASREASG